MNNRQVRKNAQHTGSYYAASAVGMREYPELAESIDCDVCVVGGGFTGLSTALNLCERGHDVVVIESNRVGWGASGRNGGQAGTGMNKPQQELEQIYGWDHAKLLWDMCEEAKAEIRRRIAKHDIDCDYKSGVIGAATTVRVADEYKEEIDHLRNKYDCESVRFVDRQEIEEMFGVRGYFGGKYDVDAGHIHPLNYAIGLGAALADSGGRIFENTSAASLKFESDATVVETDKGVPIRARVLVIACNAYLGKLAGSVSRLIMPIYSYIIATEPLDEQLAKSINRDDVAVYDSNFDLDYYRLSADRRMLFGGGESYVTERDSEQIESLLRPRMESVYPELRDCKIEYRWGGRIAITVSRLPAVGRLKPNAYYAQGFSGHGVALTGVVGKIIAEAVDGSEERFDTFARLRHRKFPSSRWAGWWLYTLATAFYKTRDYVGMQVNKRHG